MFFYQFLISKLMEEKTNKEKKIQTAIENSENQIRYLPRTKNYNLLKW